MNRIHLQIRVSLFALGLGLLVGGTAWAVNEGESELPNALSLALPPGECRLTVRADGSAHLTYGALPWHVVAAAGSFDFERLLSELRPSAEPWPGSAETADEWVAAVFPGSSTVALVRDSVMVRALMVQAWQARVEMAEPHFARGEEVIRKACGFEDTE